MAHASELLPDLKTWNDGAGVTVLDWLYGVAASDLAIAYAELFWPRFVAFEDYVLREGFSVDHVRDWEVRGKASRQGVEAAVNYLDIKDMFSGEEDSYLLDKRVKHLGRTLAEAYSVKLKRDFPDRRFQVSLIAEVDECAITFFQV